MRKPTRSCIFHLPMALAPLAAGPLIPPMMISKGLFGSLFNLNNASNGWSKKARPALKRMRRLEPMFAGSFCDL